MKTTLKITLLLLFISILSGCKHRHHEKIAIYSEPGFCYSYIGDSIGFEPEHEHTPALRQTAHKDSLMLTIHIETVEYNQDIYEIDFYHSQYIKDESPLIKINDSTALHFAVARIHVLGKKQYRYLANIYIIDKNKWRKVDYWDEWRDLALGGVLGGATIGYNWVNDMDEQKKYFTWRGTVTID